MAARKILTHDAKTRDKIKTTQLVKRLQGFALEENDPQTKKPVKMTRDQITAAIALIRKVMPDVTEVKGDIGGEITIKWADK